MKSKAKQTALLIVTLDTKGQEALFLKTVLKRLGIDVLVLDTGIFQSPVGEGDVSRREVALAGGGRSIDELIQAGNKGEAIRAMMNGAVVLTKSLYHEGRINGVLSIGGAQGTIIGTSAMRSLPLGVPKIMLSTMASGKRYFETYVGTADITLIHSVVDFFGLNSILKQMLSNAAGALAGMLRTGRVPAAGRSHVAVTVYGTTTPAGMRIVSLLQERGYETVTFHPNGVGGRAMEEMILQGRFDGVIDLTTHELIDELAGGAARRWIQQAGGGLPHGYPSGGSAGGHGLYRDGAFFGAQAGVEETHDHDTQPGDDLCHAIQTGDCEARRSDGPKVEPRSGQHRGHGASERFLLSQLRGPASLQPGRGGGFCRGARKPDQAFDSGAFASHARQR